MMKGLCVVLLILSIANPIFASSELILGRAVYFQNCAVCHGEFGKGDGPSAETMSRTPPDFTDPAMMSEITPERFERGVIQGLTDVPRHGFGNILTPEEINAVTTYVRSLIR